MADEYWFPWYPGHYDRDAGHLDHVADSCYRRLIDAYMRGGEPIPRDPARLMHITRTTPQQFQTIWPQIEGFFTETDGFLHLKRCNIELDRQDSRRKFASEAGKRSAEKRKQQFQLLLNDRSTAVQRPFNGGSTTRATRGQEITKDNINISLNAARETPVDKVGGQVNKLNGDSLRASHASEPSRTNGANGHDLAKLKAEKWQSNVIRFMQTHWPAARVEKAVTEYLSETAFGAREFETANSEMRAEAKRVSMIEGE